MRNPLNDIKAFAAVSGGISIGLGAAALLTLSPAASEDFLFGAIGAGLISFLAMIASAKIKKSGTVDCKPTEPESKHKPCGSEIIITKVRGVVKEDCDEKAC